MVVSLTNIYRLLTLWVPGTPPNSFSLDNLEVNSCSNSHFNRRVKLRGHTITTSVSKLYRFVQEDTKSQKT